MVFTLALHFSAFGIQIGCVASLLICIKLSLSQLSKLTTLKELTTHRVVNEYIENEWQLAAHDAFGVHCTRFRLLTSVFVSCFVWFRAVLGGDV